MRFDWMALSMVVVWVKPHSSNTCAVNASISIVLLLPTVTNNVHCFPPRTAVQAALRIEGHGQEKGSNFCCALRIFEKFSQSAIHRLASKLTTHSYVHREVHGQVGWWSIVNPESCLRATKTVRMPRLLRCPHRVVKSTPIAVSD